MESKLAVLAIGGNSLIKDKNHIALSWQYEAVKETGKYIADLIAEGLSIVITHGNGPQVGFIYRRGELARHELPLIPLRYLWSRHPGSDRLHDSKSPSEPLPQDGHCEKGDHGCDSDPCEQR